MFLSLSRAAWLRTIPFAVFMALLALRGWIPADGSWGVDPRWIYALTVLLVGGLLMWFWRDYGELASRQVLPSLKETALAVAVGAAVFWLWINLDAPWMKLGDPSATFRPVDEEGRVLWWLVAVRLVGATLLVPVMEELFWRSFLMRWVEKAQFETVSPHSVGLKAIALSTFVFMLAHTLWLAAIVAGWAYAWLYVRTGKLWVPVIAHAVTNGMLGAWVVLTGNWAYW
jgi:CAAX prenyl protease-like protein